MFIDVNGDGKLELAVAGQTPYEQIYVFEYVGDDMVTSLFHYIGN